MIKSHNLKSNGNEKMLKFSKANAKLQNLVSVDNIKPYLEGKRKVYSLDLLSGWSCPHAKECYAKVDNIDGRLKVVDGEHTKFRCFSASQEVFYTKTYAARKHNFDLLRSLRSIPSMVELIQKSMPKNTGVVRIHVAGDFFNRFYFEAWAQIARDNPDRLFYAYTKSLKFWLDSKYLLPYNLVLTASRGGRLDDLIDKYAMREAKVIFSEAEATGPIDHDDSHAADPTQRNKSFCLLLHGIQPAGSNAAVALRELNGKGSYRRKIG